jgi:membrane-bound lytic murein transglycosylase B
MSSPTSEEGQTRSSPQGGATFAVPTKADLHLREGDFRRAPLTPDQLHHGKMRPIRSTSSANLLKTNGCQAGAPFTAGTPNFEVAMREWNHSEVYRKTIVLMAQRLVGG